MATVVVGVLFVVAVSFDSRLPSRGVDANSLDPESHTTVAALPIFEGPDSDHVLSRSTFVSVGEYIVFLTDTPIAFGDGIRIVGTHFNDTSTEMSLSAENVNLRIPPEKYGYIVHAPAAALALRLRSEERSALEPLDFSTEIPIHSLEEVPGASQWIAVGDYIGVSTPSRLLFGSEFRVVVSGRSRALGTPMTISGGGVNLKIPPGEFGYIVMPNERQPNSSSQSRGERF